MRMNRKWTILLTVITLGSAILANHSFAQNSWMDKVKGIAKDKMANVGTKTLSDAKIADGLREALKVGIDHAIKATGKTDGFFKNDAIKILLPEKLKFAEKGLRTLGFGNKVDDFILSMNRSAEKAAPYARDIFIDSIMTMSVDDAKKILSGGNTAATDFFKSKTYDKLKQSFQPIVQKAMTETEVGKKYNDIFGKYKTLVPLLDVDQHVVKKSLDGLYQVLGQEEAKIRKDPAARVTGLLKEVFGK